MTDVNIKNELIKLVSELFQDKGIDSDLIEYVDLIEDLGMDSMIFLSVIIELETTFDIIIPDDLLLMENFREIDTIVDIVKKSVNGIGGKEAVVHDEA